MESEMITPSGRAIADFPFEIEINGIV